MCYLSMGGVFFGFASFVGFVNLLVSYPNFVRGALLDDMQLLFGPCEVLGTHH